MSVVLSCIMPVYNAALYLNDAVESVASQSWPFFELLLIDDGSTDGSDHLCDEWSRKDARIRVIHQPNRGTAAARNEGLKLASGRILCFVDADDRLRPGAFARIVPAFEQRGRDLVSFGFDRCDANSIQTAHCPDFSCESLEEFWPNFISYYQQGLFFSLCNKAYRADLIRANNLVFDRTLRTGEDIAFNFSYWKLCKSLEHIEDSLYEYWSRPDSLTRKAALDQMDTSRRVLRGLKNFLHSYGQQQLYPLLAAAQLPWDAARFFDLLLDETQPYPLQQRQAGLEKLFGDEMWHTALLTELNKRTGFINRFLSFAAEHKSVFLTTLPVRFKAR